FEHSADQLLERRQGLAFAKDYLGETAPPLAVEVQLDFTQVGRFGFDKLSEELLKRQIATQQLLSQFSDLVGFHWQVHCDCSQGHPIAHAAAFRPPPAGLTERLATSKIRPNLKGCMDLCSRVRRSGFPSHSRRP